ncbi:MAG: DUF5666 domain-containing protein [Acidimicrobiales bacterium]
MNEIHPAMSDIHPASENPDAATAELEAHQAGAIHPEDPDDEWRTAPVRSGWRLRPSTAILLALAVAGAGFAGGAALEKHHAGSSSTTAQASRPAATRTAAFGAAAGGTGQGSGAGAARGFGRGGSGAGSAAAGIVTGVQGATLFVTDANGALVKVAVPASATITRSATVPLSGLQVGDTVAVQGAKNPDGSVTASSVSAQPAAAGGGAGGGGADGGGSAGGG